MECGLGIDAGGTYTDAVIIDFTAQRVLAKAKTLTTRDDLSRGVAAVIRKLPAALLMDVQLVSLSTTLATNAIVEGKGGKVGALLLGFDAYDLQKISHTPKRAVPGRTDITGHEMVPLDEDALREAVRDLLEHEQVDAFAISGMVSVMNPRQELRARAIVQEMSDKPVICGAELTMQLDTIKRTITATLNARLLPIIAELVGHVKTVMEAAGLHVPLMVVRGDGTLMHEELARRTPVETILSGPAASVCGAQFLSGLRDGLVVDIGGTTSDIALLIDGTPVVANKGARVGPWSTNVRAIDIETVGLGGDSVVALTREGRVTLGPRRAIPLAFLAHEYPQVIAELHRLWDMREARSELVPAAEFFVAVKTSFGGDLSEREQRTMAALAEGPLSREQLAARIGALAPSLLPVARLETLGYLQRATLTPTDVLHYRQLFTAWDVQAATLALQLFAERAHVPTPELAAFILDTFSYWLTVHLMHRLIRQTRTVPDFPHSPADGALLDMLADRTDIHGLTLHAHFANSLVAIGAPAGALAVDAAQKLGASLLIPEHAEVANAIGAITGTLTLRVEATITLNQEHYLVHSPTERRAFSDLSAARTWAMEHVTALLMQKMADAQLDGFAFQHDVQCVDRTGTSMMGSMFLGCAVRATAAGRREMVPVAAQVMV